MIYNIELIITVTLINILKKKYNLKFYIKYGIIINVIKNFFFENTLKELNNFEVENLKLNMIFAVFFIIIHYI